jgi:hypothetical protein
MLVEKRSRRADGVYCSNPIVTDIIYCTVWYILDNLLRRPSLLESVCFRSDITNWLKRKEYKECKEKKKVLAKTFTFTNLKCSEKEPGRSLGPICCTLCISNYFLLKDKHRVKGIVQRKLTGVETRLN